MEITQEKAKHSRHVIYALAFLFAFSIAIPTYINSTFLAEFMGEKSVGLMYTFGSILAILGLASAPMALRKLGNVKMTAMLVFLTASSLMGLAFSKSLLPVVVLFLLYLAVYRVIALNVDILLESFSRDKSTGSIRGAFLSIMNIAWVFAPVTAGFILGSDQYWRIYGIAGVITLILIPIVLKSFKKYEDPNYERTPIWKAIKKVWRNKDVRKIVSAQFLLRFFYSWMVIYTPIYLHQHMGLQWSSIGIIFTIMLIPFVLLEYPLGRIADTKLGEKEMLTAGFIIMSAATISLTFVTSSAIWVWAVLLFLTRVGASTIEIMSETYFFKKITSDDSDLLSIFRIVAPFAYVIAPLLASIVLYFVDFRFIFLVLGIVVLWGLRYSLTLKDTL